MSFFWFRSITDLVCRLFNCDEPPNDLHTIVNIMPSTDGRRALYVAQLLKFEFGLCVAKVGRQPMREEYKIVLTCLSGEPPNVVWEENGNVRCTGADSFQVRDYRLKVEALGDSFVWFRT